MAAGNVDEIKKNFHVKPKGKSGSGKDNDAPGTEKSVSGDAQEGSWSITSIPSGRRGGVVGLGAPTDPGRENKNILSIDSIFHEITATPKWNSSPR